MMGMVSYKRSESNGYTRIHPKFFGEVKIIDPHSDPRKRDSVMKRNLSYAYSILFSVLYNGRVIRPGDREKYQLMYKFVEGFFS